ncbi:hypothetical protein R1sor_023579 [Riccia sorocarpa]|uniref:Uncharacterized protein n=1 Tax=Riccia sorocarpa TaxID=122646 RepID=A0ABD3GN64_9MARC
MTGTLDAHEPRLLRQTFRDAKITKFSQLCTPAGEIITVEQYCQNLQLQLNDDQIIVLNKLQAVLPAQQMEAIDWSTATGWTWENDTKGKTSTWNLTTRQWRQLLYKVKDETAALNEKWETHNRAATWTRRWTNLWEGNTTFRTKARMWRFLRKGFFTNSKARDWGSVLASAPDSDRTTSYVTGESAIKVAEKALQLHNANPAALLQLLTIWRINWSERNGAQFNNTDSYRGLFQILDEVKQEISALAARQGLSDKLMDKFQLAHSTLLHWSSETKRWLQGITIRTPMPTLPTINIAPQPHEDESNAMGRGIPPQHAPWTEDTMLRWDHNETNTTAEFQPRRTWRFNSATRRSRTPDGLPPRTRHNQNSDLRRTGTRGGSLLNRQISNDGNSSRATTHDRGEGDTCQLIDFNSFQDLVHALQ